MPALGELDAQETKYVHLVNKPGRPESKIQAELTKIASEREQIEDQLTGTQDSMETDRQFYLAAMKLLSDSRTFYAKTGTSLHKALNKAIFKQTPR